MVSARRKPLRTGEDRTATLDLYPLCAYHDAMSKLPIGLWGRMLAKRKIGERGCWLWTGSKTSKAGRPNSEQYGEVRVCGKLVRVHRVSAAINLGFDLKDKQDVCHKCDVPLCFNPAHLFVGSRADNNRDKARKGRGSYGPKSNKTGLTEERVVEIFIARHVEGLGVRAVGRKFRMPHNTVSNLLLGKRWPHITKMLIEEYVRDIR